MGPFSHHRWLTFSTEYILKCITHIVKFVCKNPPYSKPNKPGKFKKNPEEYTECPIWNYCCSIFLPRIALIILHYLRTQLRFPKCVNNIQYSNLACHNPSHHTDFKIFVQNKIITKTLIIFSIENRLDFQTFPQNYMTRNIQN